MFGVFKGRGFRTPWHLRVLYISTFLLRTAFGALLLLISAYFVGNEATRLLNVAIVAVPYPLAEMVTANYFGILSDRVGRKPVIVAGTTLAAIVVAMYALSDNVWYLTSLHGIHGIGAAATVAPAIAMIADHAQESDRGRQMGWFDYSTFLGYIVGAVLGGFMIVIVSVPVGFVIISLILAASAIMLFALVKRTAPAVKGAHKSGFAELRNVFRVREVRLIFPIWLVIATLLGLALTYLPIILMGHDVSGSTIGIMFGLAGVALGLLQPFWGKVSDIVGRIPVMAYGVFSIAGIVVLLVFFPNTAVEVNETAEGVTDIEFHLLGMIPLAIMGLGAGAFVPSALAMMADSSESRSYGATMGLYSFALGFGAFIAETLGLIIIYVNKDEAENTTAGLILYFAAALVALAVLMMIVFFLSTYLKNRARNQRA